MFYRVYMFIPAKKKVWLIVMANGAMAHLGTVAMLCAQAAEVKDQVEACPGPTFDHTRNNLKTTPTSEFKIFKKNARRISENLENHQFIGNSIYSISSICAPLKDSWYCSGRSVAAPSAEIGIRLWRLPPFRDSCQDATIAKAISIPTSHDIGRSPCEAKPNLEFQSAIKMQSNKLNSLNFV